MEEKSFFSGLLRGSGKKKLNVKAFGRVRCLYKCNWLMLSVLHSAVEFRRARLELSYLVTSVEKDDDILNRVYSWS